MSLHEASTMPNGLTSGRNGQPPVLRSSSSSSSGTLSVLGASNSGSRSPGSRSSSPSHDAALNAFRYPLRAQKSNLASAPLSRDSSGDSHYSSMSAGMSPSTSTNSIHHAQQQSSSGAYSNSVSTGSVRNATYDMAPNGGSAQFFHNRKTSLRLANSGMGGASPELATAAAYSPTAGHSDHSQNYKGASSDDIGSTSPAIGVSTATSSVISPPRTRRMPSIHEDDTAFFSTPSSRASSRAGSVAPSRSSSPQPSHRRMRSSPTSPVLSAPGSPSLLAKVGRLSSFGKSDAPMLPKHTHRTSPSLSYPAYAGSSVPGTWSGPTGFLRMLWYNSRRSKFVDHSMNLVFALCLLIFVLALSGIGFDSNPKPRPNKTHAEELLARKASGAIAYPRQPLADVQLPPGVQEQLEQGAQVNAAALARAERQERERQHQIRMEQRRAERLARLQGKLPPLGESDHSEDRREQDKVTPRLPPNLAAAPEEPHDLVMDTGEEEEFDLDGQQWDEYDEESTKQAEPVINAPLAAGGKGKILRAVQKPEEEDISESAHALHEADEIDTFGESDDEDDGEEEAAALNRAHQEAVAAGVIARATDDSSIEPELLRDSPKDAILDDKHADHEHHPDQSNIFKDAAERAAEEQSAFEGDTELPHLHNDANVALSDDEADETDELDTLDELDHAGEADGKREVVYNDFEGELGGEHVSTENLAIDEDDGELPAWAVDALAEHAALKADAPAYDHDEMTRYEAAMRLRQRQREEKLFGSAKQLS
ncbi:uncharacterized protein L969DRAFT_398183 [Mixia osmundae IAM 14324]|uniref:Uncharacterized protein n=1 Tax=Mixia osmundae (strain CBS 9802 / IAM 14324 / JCM 22182 / KY 12970) TaxID=764103 RepID=G7E9T9_MIXOS|nr:uncharacterized protein L969DRAFT_398183 [Mixia osmundae IAM 14324]KEI40041.1 hypothetical protein L969DRAFT_398183 [Mixia osmundae IAM 14324]GAA99408.1 hypothetical protein E5Q_06106 [Mixia osmundae IAM 14324]